ncbi:MULTISPECIES: DNA topoisomerase [Eisenbergiella]|uniref:DNA topoisomerase n=3 Tax=Eisenbergiella porci TaxID=2652274 RepID=A0A6N7VZ41_9FIRM|nr:MULTISPECIES: DNA topoisomerase [Eisenbergiella]MSS88279.1 type IA DNA topoisomerase [Eisenbergiella porci]
MGKDLFIAEKPSVAREFAKALKYNMSNRDGYMESNEAVVTWCVGHLVTMSYPDAYDPELKRWTLKTLPFIPEEYKYEVIPGVQKQFDIVSGLLNRADVTRIYVCTDSGREGEYIYRLVERQAGVHGKERRRVWIDSQTEEEILRGIREAKDLSAYDSLCDAAYLRAKEDYLMGINFSRVLTLKYGTPVKNYLKRDKAVISVGRVMTCVLGMVVNREREIRQFVKTPFYRVTGRFSIVCQAKDNQASASLAAAENGSRSFEGEWRAVEGSRWFQSPLLYKENGFKDKEEAQKLINFLEEEPREIPVVDKIERKKEQKNPPLLYNLAELQNDCSKYFKISPDETLRIVQELYEKKLTTYPRTDARVLSTAVAKEISKNISGLRGISSVAPFAAQILESKSYQGIAKTRYVNDKQITDHYAIIPTGQGLGALKSVSATAAKVYEIIVRRFLSIFYPPAVYQKVSLVSIMKGERFFASFRVLTEEGYLKVSQFSFSRKKEDVPANAENRNEEKDGAQEDVKCDAAFLKILQGLKKGTPLVNEGLEIKEGETSPPKRYNSGTMILTMENAGQFIEDDELRAQIKGSGIGTSATRAEILKKLVSIQYLDLNKKTQIITPTQMGEMIYDVVSDSIRPLLNPALTASWEKGLTMVADGTITSQEYMKKLTDFVGRRTNIVKQLNNQQILYRQFEENSKYYTKQPSRAAAGKKTEAKEA